MRPDGLSSRDAVEVELSLSTVVVVSRRIGGGKRSVVAAQVDGNDFAVLGDQLARQFVESRWEAHQHPGARGMADAKAGVGRQCCLQTLNQPARQYVALSLRQWGRLDVQPVGVQDTRVKDRRMTVDVAGDEGDESGRPDRRCELDASPCVGVLGGIGVKDVEVGLQFVLLADLGIAVVIGLVDLHFIVVRQGGALVEALEWASVRRPTEMPHCRSDLA